MNQISHALQIAVEALRIINSNRRVLTQALCLNCIVLLSLVWITGRYSDLPLWGNLLAFIISGCAYILVAITTHRVILLGSNSVSKWGDYKLTNREIRFILLSIGLAILTIPAGMMIAIPVFGVPLGLIFYTYIAARFSLVFPSTAVDENWPIAKAWGKSRGHEILLGFAVVVIPIAISIAQWLMSYIPYSGAIITVISIATTVYIIAVLSLTYDYIRNQKTTTTPSDNDFVA